MATTSIPHPWTYDVFVSFRGEDIRKSFMDHLFKDFRQKGIRAFRDDNELPRGEEISPQLYKAIEESRFLIVVFSENYASSSWCLRELVKILHCKQMGKPKHEVRIIFYDVKPDVVRKQTGCYAKAFAKHEFSNKTEVAKWKEALSMAANLSGWDLEDMANGYESKLIDSISKEILKEFCHGPLPVGEKLVGVDARIEKMNLSRFVGSSKVHMIGICGMSGVGKTTLAKVIYNMLFIHFEECSFCDDVKGTTKCHGLIQVVKQLIHDIMKTSDVQVSNTDQGVIVMRHRMASRQILLVLDGVDHHKQLEALAGSCEWFSPGSLIIFTSQDKQLLRSHKVEEIFDIELLDDGEALELFNLYAFNKRHPREDFEKLAYQVVEYVQGHPYALKVLGLFLYDKTVCMWKNELDKLRIHPNMEIQKVFRLCFDGLDIVQQGMLLDIACYLIGRKKDFATSVLDSCGFFAHTNMQVLLDKSFITISNIEYRGMYLEMHDLIREMAREIVREESKRPGERSRLWIPSKVCDVLSKNKATEAVEVLVLLLGKSSQKVDIDVKVFAHMKKLRILKVCYPELKYHTMMPEIKESDVKESNVKESHVNFFGSLEFLSNDLRLLYWHGCPFKSLPLDFYPENIVHIDLSYSHIKNLWTAPMCFKRLKVMKLKHCRNLSSTPDFTEITNLEELHLVGCVNLVKLHPSIGMLKRLVVLNMRNCTRLRSFPCEVETDSLEVLVLSACSKLDKLPAVLGTIKTLKRLCVDGTSIKQFPSFVCSLSNLEEFSIGRREGIQSRQGTLNSQLSWLLTKLRQPQSLVLPSLASLRLLRELDVSYCNISEVSPDSIRGLPCLYSLNMSGNNFTSLPASLSQLPGLVFLTLGDCKKLEVMPKLPPSVQGFTLSSLCYPYILDLSNGITLDFSPLPQLQKLLDMPINFLRYLFLIAFPKLVENLTIDQSLVFMSMHPQRYDPRCPLEWDISFQGNIIPECFPNQNTGNKVTVELPGGWCYNKFWGYATCVHFKLTKSYNWKWGYLARLSVTNFNGAGLDEGRFSSDELMTQAKFRGDFLWLRFSRHRSSRDWIKAENFITFSFEGFCGEVKACGVRLICDEDIQEETGPSSSLIQLQGLPTPNHDWISGSTADESPFKKSRTV